MDGQFVSTKTTSAFHSETIRYQGMYHGASAMNWTGFGFEYTGDTIIEHMLFGKSYTRSLPIRRCFPSLWWFVVPQKQLLQFENNFLWTFPGSFRWSQHTICCLSCITECLMEEKHTCTLNFEDTEMRNWLNNYVFDRTHVRQLRRFSCLGPMA